MGRVARVEQAARTRARERWSQAADQDRADRDRRIEAAAAEVFLGLAAREHAAALVCDAETRAGAALRRLLAEDIDVDQAAELSGLTVREVRRLSRDRRRPSSVPVREPGEPAPALTRDGQPV